MRQWTHLEEQASSNVRLGRVTRPMYEYAVDSFDQNKSQLPSIIHTY